MTLSDDAFKVSIPYYLVSAPEQKAFLRELEALRNGSAKGYYIAPNSDPFASEVLQGDCWSGFQLFVFSSGTARPVRGIVLSNSCDIAPENGRTIPPKVVFAPVVKLSQLAARFKSAGLSDPQVDAKIKAIKSQEVTSLFYLPQGASLSEDYVVNLDDVHSMPFDAFNTGSTKAKHFTLSMAGFYMFVFKLSIHFCRLHENVDRRPKAA
ncbi:hypothetical protein NBH20_01300 [Rhizobium sp. S153]|uniref:Cytokinin glycosidase domain-containing protein n=1 Tax=Ciceribacter sichuanensis TaxID=2949647 RepID=A0ABT0V471_9HYPH|nr:hypothetical protein [Ciceribacter sp. S153]MCM2399777.1 hypothetical protein [Ciceribacter sp. S153]